MIETPIDRLGTEFKTLVTKYAQCLHTSKKALTMAVSLNSMSFTYWSINDRPESGTQPRIMDSIFVFLHFA